MNRAVSVARMQLINKWTFVGIPVLIIAGSFALTYAIGLMVPNTGGTFHSGASRWLKQEQDRLVRQIRAVENTIRAQEEGDQLMAKDMFDGFDHTQYKDEVEQRWGKKAYAAGDRWWRSKTEDEKQAFKDQHLQIAWDYAVARETGQAPDSEVVQAIVERHLAWLNLSASVTGGPVTSERFIAYGEMYAADERFANNYGGTAGAEFVRDAISSFAAKERT